MLWVNLIMDTFAALALATEPPSPELLLRKPYNKDDSILNAVMWRNIIGQAIYQIIVLLVLLFLGQTIFNLPYDEKTPFYADELFIMTHPNSGIAIHDPTNKCIVYTILFQTFVFMQLFN